jgi:GH24 family phage-related lysozyme (muramidase)
MSDPVPQEAIQLIQEFEGCHRLDPRDGAVHAYPDPLTNAEPWTIGWGTTVYPDGQRVGPNDVISQEQADQCFTTILERDTWQPISRSIPFWSEMNAPMRSALCSFAYNLGSGFYGAGGFDTISRVLREKRWPEVPDALLLYVNPGTSVEAGLRRRRIAEGDLWRQGLEQLGQGAEPPPFDVGPADLPTTPEVGSLLLEAITPTFFKKENLDATQLPPHQLVAVESGRCWKCEALLKQEGQSLHVRLAYGAGDWWIYGPHWRQLGTTPTGAAPEGPSPTPAPGAVGGEHDLAVPYLSQLDNRYNPYGSCNVTCVAMCLYYLGMPRREGTQLEDELYVKLEDMGRSRHNPYDLKYLIETYPGYKDIFRENGSFADIRGAIDAGHPVIVHGYFTSFGHIIVIRGYDDTGFLVNDPYGEWFSSGYDNSRSGERLHYSHDLIARTCSPESRSNPANIWIHTVMHL